MSSPDRSDQLDLALLRRMLNVDDEASPYELVRAARKVGWSLPPLVLSVMAREGVKLGAGSRDELRRCRARAATYDRVLEAVRTVARARVVKGPSLARHYPAGVVRPVGDIDLRVSTEAELWRAVLRIADEWPVEHIDVSMMGVPRHFFVRVEWRSDDPPIEPNVSVELQTAAYGGNLGPAGMRAELPPTDNIADLLALAEERFQRPFQAKDAIDLILLSRTGLLCDRSLPDVAAGYGLAPELVELVEFTRAFHPVELAPAVAEGLAAAADRERDRRGTSPAAGEPETGGPETGGPETGEPKPDVDSRLATGLPVYGMLVRRADRRSGMEVARVRRFSRGQLLLTPVADYLLVDAAVVDPELYHTAQAELEQLSPAA